jgi:hypothetical protein
MLTLLALLASTVQLVDDRYDIPAAEWRFVDVFMNQELARVYCSYEVAPPHEKAHVGLIRAEDLPRFRANQPFTPILMSGPAQKGAFDVRPQRSGEYAVVIDNRHNGSPVQVSLRVWLDFGHRTSVRYADPRRQLIVILVSFAVFFAIVTYSARKLLAAARRR